MGRALEGQSHIPKSLDGGEGLFGDAIPPTTTTFVGGPLELCGCGWRTEEEEDEDEDNARKVLWHQ